MWKADLEAVSVAKGNWEIPQIWVERIGLEHKFSGLFGSFPISDPICVRYLFLNLKQEVPL